MNYIKIITNQSNQCWFTEKYQEMGIINGLGDKTNIIHTCKRGESYYRL